MLFYSVDNTGNQEDEKTCSFTIHYTTPIEITIKGGFGLTAIIKNTGTTDITDATLTISLDGNMIFWGKEKTATIDIAAGETRTLKSFVFGFGATNIEVTVDTITESASGKVLLFFVLGVA